MEIQETQHSDILVLHIKGQVDSSTASILGDKLDAVIGKGLVRLILDLSEVPYMSSAGLRVLSITLKTLRDSDVNGEVCLACLSKTVTHAFRVSGFNQVFCIYDDVPEALTALSA